MSDNDSGWYIEGVAKKNPWDPENMSSGSAIDSGSEDEEEVESRSRPRHKYYSDITGTTPQKRESITVRYIDEDERGVRRTVDCDCGGSGAYEGHSGDNICAHRYRVEWLGIVNAWPDEVFDDDARYEDWPSKWDIQYYD